MHDTLGANDGRIMKVKVATANSPLEKAMQEIEAILEKNDMSMDIGRVFIGNRDKEKCFDLHSMCGGGTGMLPRSTDDEKFVLREN